MKIGNKHHQELWRNLQLLAQKKTAEEIRWLQNYLGTRRNLFFISSARIKAIAKKWLGQHPNLTQAELIELLGSLFKGASFDEVALGGKLLGAKKEFREKLDPAILAKWLESLSGWAEVDSLCQSSFTAQEMLADWPHCEKQLVKLSKDKSAAKRRASLVLLTKAVRDLAEPRLAELAFQNIGRLQKEKDILITKAVSWLLRDLIKNNKQWASI